jgi:hypothetical protein
MPPLQVEAWAGTAIRPRRPEERSPQNGGERVMRLDGNQRRRQRVVIDARPEKAVPWRSDTFWMIFPASDRSEAQEERHCGSASFANGVTENAHLSTVQFTLSLLMFIFTVEGWVGSFRKSTIIDRSTEPLLKAYFQRDDNIYEAPNGSIRPCETMDFSGTRKIKCLISKHRFRRGTNDVFLKSRVVDDVSGRRSGQFE